MTIKIDSSDKSEVEQKFIEEQHKKHNSVGEVEVKTDASSENKEKSEPLSLEDERELPVISDDLEDDDDEDGNEEESHNQEDEGKKRKRKGGFTKRIEKLLREKEDLLSKHTQLMQEMEALKTGNKKTEKVEPKKNTDKAPEPGDYDDWSDYVEALVDWKAEQKIKEVEKNRFFEEEQKKLDAQNKEWEKRKQEARDRHKDFDQVMKSTQLPLTLPVQQVMFSSEVGADLAYWLAVNPTKATELFSKSVPEQLKELGKLEDRLIQKFKSDKKQDVTSIISSAPKGLSTVNSKNAGPSVYSNIEKMSFQDYKAWREKNKR